MADLQCQLERLAILPSHALAEEWQKVTRMPAPRLPPALLRLGIAYRLQEKAEGGLSRAARAELKRLAATPAAAAAPAKPRLRPGTHLVRQWHGTTYRVEVERDAFLHEGRRYSSLSAIAEEITGTRWSGPRFFGVRGA